MVKEALATGAGLATAEDFNGAGGDGKCGAIIDPPVDQLLTQFLHPKQKMPKLAETPILAVFLKKRT